MKLNRNLIKMVGWTIIGVIGLTDLSLYAGTNTAAFLNKGVGARALGMGGAFVAIADDYTAAYWNPAGLALVDRVSIGTMVDSLASERWPGMKDITPKSQFASLVIPLEKLTLAGFLIGGSAAFSWISSQLNDVPYTQTDAGGSLVRAGSFSDREDGYILSYGRELFFEELSGGGSLKIVQQRFSGIDGGQANGWGLDGGLLYSLSEKLKFGLLIEKGVTMNWANGHRDVGNLREKLGLSYQYLNFQKIKGLLAFDIEQVKKEPLVGRLGAELKCIPAAGASGFKVNDLSLRAGLDEYVLENRYGMQSKMNNNLSWTFGLGLDLGVLGQSLGLDYSFGSYRLGDQHRFSLGISF